MSQYHTFFEEVLSFVCCAGNTTTDDDEKEIGIISLVTTNTTPFYRHGIYRLGFCEEGGIAFCFVLFCFVFWDGNPI